MTINIPFDCCLDIVRGMCMDMHVYTRKLVRGFEIDCMGRDWGMRNSRRLPGRAPGNR